MKTFLSITNNGISRAERIDDDNWRVENLLAEQEITCLSVDPLQAGAIFAGTRGKGVLYSTDYGKTWSSAGLVGHIVKAISLSPLNPGVIYAGTKPALLYVSYDGGQQWEELSTFRKINSRRFWFSPAETPFTAYIQGIALSPADQNLIVVGIEFGAVVRSTDGGRTWQDHRRGALRDCHSITFHASTGNWVYEAGGTGAGTAISQDGGNTWTQNRAGLDRHYGWACAADPIHPEISYLSISPSPTKAHSENNAQACIFRYDAEGKWKKLNGGLPQPLDHMPYALLTDPSEPDHVYAGLSNGDVWRSQDRGDSWSQMPFNLVSVRRSMVMLL
jgi:BNR/Asp-box repeat